MNSADPADSRGPSFRRPQVRRGLRSLDLRSTVQELLHARVRIGSDLIRSADGNHLTMVHHGNPVRNHEGARHFVRSEEHTSELQSRLHLVCRLLLEKKKKNLTNSVTST